MNASDTAITQTVDGRQLEQAARVFYEAFRPKIDSLEIVPRSAEQAVRILAASFRPEMGFFAVRDGAVVGLAGMQDSRGQFFDVGWSTWRREFGLAGGLRRRFWQVLGHVFVPVRRDETRVQGIAVDAASRGQGIGALLLAHLEDHARALGRRAVILEVVDTNPDAQRLYERLGYRVTKVEHYGRWSASAGFSGAAYMRKELD